MLNAALSFLRCNMYDFCYHIICTMWHSFRSPKPDANFGENIKYAIIESGGGVEGGVEGGREGGQGACGRCSHVTVVALDGAHVRTDFCRDYRTAVRTIYL